MKMKNILLLCTPGGNRRIKELDRYGPELRPKVKKSIKDSSNHPHRQERPPLIPSLKESVNSRSRNSSGSASGGSSSSTSSFGKSIFYDKPGKIYKHKKWINTSDSPIPSSVSSDDHITNNSNSSSVLENLDNYDLSSFVQALEPNLKVGDRIVWLREQPQSNEAGIVRWLGEIDNEEIAGIEFDRELKIGSGWYRNRQLFDCKPEHGGLVAVVGLILEEDLNQFGYTIKSSPVPVTVDDTLATMPQIPFVHPPLNEEIDSKRFDGRRKGIQGHRNSCYLDSTLFAMFSFTSVFDSILMRPYDQLNNDEGVLAMEVQRILREEIVNPLRKDVFTPAQNVMHLRETMYHLDVKLTSEEMDPQEFLEMLFSRVLHLEEFLSLSSGESDFFHQVLCKGDAERLPTVQELFEESLREQKLKLKSVPSPVLILQMPRSGNKFKMFKGILPNLSIDITDLIDDIPRMCIICGALATNECPDCYGNFNTNENRQESGGSRTPLGSRAFSTAFCGDCVVRVHLRAERRSHMQKIIQIEYSFNPEDYFPTPSNPYIPPKSNGVPTPLSSPNYSPASAYFPPERISSYGLPTPPNHNSSFHVSPYTNGNPPLFLTTSSKSIPRVTMELFAVICIETSHFVSFVKCGKDRKAGWAFFDSMADRMDNIDGSGQNIPQVKYLSHMGTWLDHLERDSTFLPGSLDTVTPELKRLLSDPYICLYYSPSSAMYC